MNTTRPHPPGTGGWRTGRRRRSSPSTSPIASMLSAADVHDARRRRGGCQRLDRLPRLRHAWLTSGTKSSSPRRARASAAARPHEHWHVDVPDINVAGTDLFLCSLLDSPSGLIVHWEIREQMTEADVETIIQRGRESSHAPARIISEKPGLEFIAKDFKEFILICGMTHVRTSPNALQSNGKIEVRHGWLIPRHLLACRCRWRTPSDWLRLRVASQRGPLALCDW